MIIYLIVILTPKKDVQCHVVQACVRQSHAQLRSTVAATRATYPATHTRRATYPHSTAQAATQLIDAVDTYSRAAAIVCRVALAWARLAIAVRN